MKKWTRGWNELNEKVIFDRFKLEGMVVASGGGGGRNDDDDILRGWRERVLPTAEY